MTVKTVAGYTFSYYTCYPAKTALIYHYIVALA